MKILLLIMLFLLTSCTNQNELNNTPAPSFDNEVPLELITYDDNKMSLNKDDNDLLISYVCNDTELYNIEYPFTNEIYNTQSDIKLFDNDFSLILKDPINYDTVYLNFENNNELRIIYKQKEVKYTLDKLPFKDNLDDTIKDVYLKGNNFPLSMMINNKIKDIKIYLLDYTFDDDILGVELLFKDDGLNNFIDIIKTNTLMDYTIEDDKSNPKPGYFFSECENNVVSIILDDGLNETILTDGLCNKVDAQFNNSSICSYLSSDIKISEYIYEKAKECLDIAMLFSDSSYSTYLMPLHFENDEIIINSSKEDYPHIPYILRPNEKVKDFKDYNLKAYIDNNEVDEIELIDDKKPHEIIFKDINNNEYLYVYQFEQND